MAVEVRTLTWEKVEDLAAQLAGRWVDAPVTAVYGVPRGGITPAVMVARHLRLPLVEAPTADTLVVDDLVDSGATAARFTGFPFDALLRKPTSPFYDGMPVADGWVVFPWETADEATGPTDAVRRLLQYVGEDPDREGLMETPNRVVKALAELTAGYALDPATVLGTTFDEQSDELVIVRGIEFTSLCEHHLLPFVGTCTVGYLPGDRVVGLSKLARLVDCYARRLQVQERMTTQIAQAIETHLGALGVGVIVRAHHSCMGCRGVRKPTAEMVTSAMLGSLRSEPAGRAEFLHLAGMV